MAAREFLRLTQETTWGVYPTSPANSVVAVINLHQANAFTPRVQVVTADLRSAGGSNRKVVRVGPQKRIGGTLATRLYPSQAKLIVPWAVGITSSGGAPYDLPSFTADHGFWLDDGSACVRRRYLGGKVGKLTIAAGNSGDNVMASIALDMTFKQEAAITGTDLPEPAYGTAPTYPTDIPYLFEELAGNLTLGAARTAFRSISLVVDNKLRAPFDEGQYISSLRWSGRDVTLEADFRYLSTTDRSNYEAQAALAASLAFADGTNTATFNLFGNAHIDSLSDDLGWDDPGFYQKLTMSSLLDPGASPANDISFAQTP